MEFYYIIHSELTFRDLLEHLKSLLEHSKSLLEHLKGLLEVLV